MVQSLRVACKNKKGIILHIFPQQITFNYHVIHLILQRSWASIFCILICKMLANLKSSLHCKSLKSNSPYQHNLAELAGASESPLLYETCEFKGSQTQPILKTFIVCVCWGGQAITSSD